MDLTLILADRQLKLQFFALIALGVITLVLAVAAVIRLCLRSSKIRQCRISEESVPGGTVSKVLTVVLCIAAAISLIVTGLCGYIFYLSLIHI